MGWLGIPTQREQPSALQRLAERPVLTEWNAVCYEAATGLLL
jgi:hypothetical protein